MKISKNQLEQLILEELREQLLEQSRLEKMAGALKKGAKSVGSAVKKGVKAAGQELGLSKVDYKKAKKDFDKMIQSSGGDYYKALSDFIGKYGDPKDDTLQYLRAEFDKLAQKGSGIKAKNPVAASNPIKLEEEFTKGKMSFNDFQELKDELLTVGINLPLKDARKLDKIIKDAGVAASSNVMSDAEKDPKYKDQIPTQLKSLIGATFEADELNKIMPKIKNQVKGLSIGQKLQFFNWMASQFGLYDVITKRPSDILKMAKKAVGLTEYKISNEELNHLILEEAIMEVYSFSMGDIKRGMGDMFSSLNPFSSSKVERQPAPQGKVLRSKKFPEDRKYKRDRTELYNIFLPIDKPRSKQFVEDLYNEKYTGMPKPAVTPPRDIRGLVEIMKKNAEATMGSDNLDLDLEGYLRNYYK